ncbi:MAG: Maf family protein [Candidatus Dependentiae bacterium]|nr:Maf family protein [Candidatus Dependentiae bacterium]
MNHTLFLGSKSQSRQMLLREAQIPFVLANQDADEAVCDWNLPLEQAVAAIAAYKMQHVILPHSSEGDCCFVLTADTLSTDVHGKLNGKPVDRADAIKKIKDNRDSMIHLATAFCLERKVYHNGQWHQEELIDRVICARYLFDVPDAWIDIYLEKSLGLTTSGAVAIELFGSQFLKTIEGSYTTIIGLPLFEVREALTELGFFDDILKKIGNAHSE